MTEHVAQEHESTHESTIEELKGEQEQLREKAERKRLESFWWAAVIIWSGLIFLAEFLEILPEIGEAGAWSWIFLGAGLFGFAGAAIRGYSTEMPNATGWDIFWSAVFFIIGSTGFFGGGIAFPVALVVVGIVILVNVLFHRD